MTTRNGIAPGVGVSGGVFGAGPVSYSPAITWPGNTITGPTALFIHLPFLLLLWGSFTNSAGTATALLTIPLPTGLVTAVLGSNVPAGTVMTNAGASSVTLVASTGGVSLTPPSTTPGVVGAWMFQATIPVTW